jgi:hypothetical protein
VVKGQRLARAFLKVELLVTYGGCPWCRARQRAYGVRPDEPLPPKGPDKVGANADHR